LSGLHSLKTLAAAPLRTRPLNEIQKSDFDQEWMKRDKAASRCQFDTAIYCDKCLGQQQTVSANLSDHKQ
jgi:hypothetical protein